MTSPTVEVLLRGYSMASDEGSLGFCGVYLVQAADSDGSVRRVLYDTGHAGRRRALVRALEARGIRIEDIDTVVISHAHYDHAQNVDLFAGSRVLLHADELAYAMDPATRDAAMPPWTAAILSIAQPQPVADGDELLPGVSVIHLPGHTIGSIGLVVATDDGVAVLTGDALSSRHVFTTGKCSVVHFDEASAERSIARVRETAELIYPGHDRPFRVGADGASDYLEAATPLVFRVQDPVAARASVAFEQS